MSLNSITWVGMDAHKNSIAVAALFPERSEAVEWTETATPEAIRRLGRRLRREAPGEVRCCYEAGPTGYALHRQLEAAGVICEVVAPSLTPVKPGSRIKTDRRDARKLAELLRAGLLTEVHPPSESDEALRDLCRCRDDVRRSSTATTLTAARPRSAAAAVAAQPREPARADLHVAARRAAVDLATLPIVTTPGPVITPSTVAPWILTALAPTSTLPASVNPAQQNEPCSDWGPVSSRSALIRLLKPLCLLDGWARPPA